MSQVGSCGGCSIFAAWLHRTYSIVICCSCTQVCHRDNPYCFILFILAEQDFAVAATILCSRDSHLILKNLLHWKMVTSIAGLQYIHVNSLCNTETKNVMSCRVLKDNMNMADNWMYCGFHMVIFLSVSIISWTAPDVPVIDNVVVDATSITLSLSLPRGIADSYELQYRPLSTISRTVLTIEYQTTVRYMVSDLQSATLYSFEVISQFQNLVSNRVSMEIRTGKTFWYGLFRDKKKEKRMRKEPYLLVVGQWPFYIWVCTI